MSQCFRISCSISLSIYLLSCAEQPGFKVSDTGNVVTVSSTSNEGDATDGSISYSAENTAESADLNTDSSNSPSSGDSLASSESTPKPSTMNAQEKFEDSCNGTRKSVIQQVHFPEMKNCRFGSNGNLNRRDRYLQARESQSAELRLPQGAQLCGLELRSEENRIQYDDFIILSLNDFVLLSSNQKMLNKLSGIEQGAYIWDFNKVRGTAVDFNSPAYCLGGSTGNCSVPVTDTPGRFGVDIGSEALVGVADKIVDQTNLTLSLTATGDNDDEDCWHTAIDLEFTLFYAD